MKYDILIAGIGGQGTVMASKILAASAIDRGLFARTSETIGMAQRGGPVTSHVRIGSLYASSVIPLGKADLLMGYEPTETLRNMTRLSRGGHCIVNTKMIKPFSGLSSEGAVESDAIKDAIRTNHPETIFVDGNKLAENIGSNQVLNIAFLGIAAYFNWLPLNRESVEKNIRRFVPKKLIPLNLEAFNYARTYNFMI